MNIVDKPLISIIIPVYNTEAYIGKCLESVLNNTYQNLQVICVNDGSTDRSLSVLNEYSNNDPRVVVLDKKNGGVSSARNTGLEYATGEFISFIDSDDVILPDYYEFLMEIMLDNQADIIDCLKGSKITMPVKKNYSMMDQFGMAKNKHMRTYAAGKIYKRAIIGGNRFTEGISLYEDCFFNMSIIGESIKGKKNLKGILVNSPMYLYTARQGSAMYQSTYKKAMPSIEYLEKMVTNEKTIEVSSLYAVEYIRKALLTWYDLYLNDLDYERRIIQKQMRKVSKKMIPSKNYTKKELLKFKVFAYFPQLYRHFRLIDDPTMRQYEASVKKK